MNKWLALLLGLSIAVLVGTGYLYFHNPVPTITLDCSSNYNTGYNQGYQDRIASENTTPLQHCDLCVNYPTTKQVMDFLATDKTDRVHFSASKFCCTDFAQKVNENAWAVGIPCYTVVLVYQKDNSAGHAIVAFPVVDRDTLLYIEPQQDKEVFGVSVGDTPFTCQSEESCKFLFTEPILRILIYR